MDLPTGYTLVFFHALLALCISIIFPVQKPATAGLDHRTIESRFRKESAFPLSAIHPQLPFMNYRCGGEGLIYYFVFVVSFGIVIFFLLIFLDFVDVLLLDDFIFFG